ncbi:unnamed protein product, partial [Prorocentrum cordatum]
GRNLDKSWVDVVKKRVHFVGLPSLVMISPCCGVETPLLALAELGIKCKSYAWDIDEHLRAT